MDWVSVQCSCQSFTFGVPFVGLGKFYTVDSPKEIGPFLAKEKKNVFFLAKEEKYFFSLARKKETTSLISSNALPYTSLCGAKVAKNGFNFKICDGMQ